MAQRDLSAPIKAPRCGERSPCPAGDASVRHAVTVGSLILAWASLMPLAWLSLLLVNHDRAAMAVLLCGTGLPVFVWSTAQLRRRLFSLLQDNASRKWERGTVGMIPLGSIQACSAILCTYFAGPVITPGLQYWFWVPIPAFGGLLLAKRTQMAALLAILLLVSSICHHWSGGSHDAWLWVAGQGGIGAFTMACCAAVAWTARQRQATAHMAADVVAANARLELQADQASVLTAAQERHQLAKEMEASVGHHLAIVDTQLELAQKLLPPLPDKSQHAVQRARWAAHDGQAEIRRSISINGIVPNRRKQSLTESLASLVRTAEHAGLTLSIGQTGVYRLLPTLVEISLYRCAQEGISKARRHAQATDIKVTLDFSSSSVVSLFVRDNGHELRDFSREDAVLKRLEERALLLHGKFRTGTTPCGGGFCQMALPG